MNSLLLKYPKETLSLLKEWNRSRIRWKRRASIVTFTREIAKSGKFTDEVIQLSENLIWDKEDIVQKGFVNVFRLKQDLFTESYIGLIFTDKELTEFEGSPVSDYNRVGGVDGRFKFWNNY